MVYCVKCGADNDPNTSRFCRACGTPLAAPAMAVAPPPSLAGIATAPMPPHVGPAKPKRRGQTAGLIFLLVFAGLVIAAMRSRQKPNSEPNSVDIVQVTPTLKELQAAQRAGLSPRFAAQGWSAFIYNERKYVQLAGLNTELPTPSDDDLRSYISQLRDLAQTDADKAAFQRVSASLWANHMAKQFEPRGRNDPLFQDAGRVADDCYFAMLNSFRDSTKNLGRGCLDNQSKVKAEFVKQGISSWGDL